MQIALCRFVGKPTTITCIRDDGSITWQTYGPHSDFFAIHDLTHYAVETELGYKHGFFGMIAQGRDINDFGPGSAASLHPEAFHAEMLAGLLSTAEGNGARLTYEEIKSTRIGTNKCQTVGPADGRKSICVLMSTKEYKFRW